MRAVTLGLLFILVLATQSVTSQLASRFLPSPSVVKRLEQGKGKGRVCVPWSFLRNYYNRATKCERNTKRLIKAINFNSNQPLRPVFKRVKPLTRRAFQFAKAKLLLRVKGLTYGKRSRINTGDCPTTDDVFAAIRGLPIGTDVVPGLSTPANSGLAHICKPCNYIIQLPNEYVPNKVTVTKCTNGNKHCSVLVDGKCIEQSQEVELFDTVKGKAIQILVPKSCCCQMSTMFAQK